MLLQLLIYNYIGSIFRGASASSSGARLTSSRSRRRMSEFDKSGRLYTWKMKQATNEWKTKKRHGQKYEFAAYRSGACYVNHDQGVNIHTWTVKQNKINIRIEYGWWKQDAQNKNGHKMRVGRVEKITIGKNVGCLALLHRVLVRIAWQEQAHKRIELKRRNALP